ncbi:radical SAM/SPASM domain-containing protein [Aegicerativicinus sediminis]|uniref:radical SAM/SPASM domain-containing protein n=1 Tax=Aegicerativicinus sediminis TaxID=2893202 RepID=UPI001E3ADB8C|nr:radical SAM protein [Aegicerativicinus sediminis]
MRATILESNINRESKVADLRLIHNKELVSKSKNLVGRSLIKRHWFLRFSLIKILIETYKNPFDWIRGMIFLIRLRKSVLGEFTLKKMVEVDGKSYMGLYTPGWNDSIYRRFITSELIHFKSHSQKVFRFNHVHLAITNKCALRCDHCYAWDNLNQRDPLNKEEMISVIQKIQSLGTAQIHFTGGEPMIKLDILLELVRAGNWKSNLWLNTSGFKLTFENARKLKKEGLTGVMISLDHFEENKHNDFRKYKGAYRCAIEGAKNCINNGLVTAFSICVSNEFVTVTNLDRYMELAKDIGVHFVQILEPKKVGHYKGKDVELEYSKIKILEKFYETYNFTNDYLEYPLISYHGYYQRRMGCFAGAKRSIYLDAKGDLHACTFCHSPYGNVLDDNFDSQLINLRENGCPTFRN